MRQRRIGADTIRILIMTTSSAIGTSSNDVRAMLCLTVKRLALTAAMPLALFGQMVHAQDSPPEIEAERRAKLRTARSATVSVLVTAGREAGGSGFVVSSSGLIVTAAHVVRGASKVDVRLASGLTLASRGLIYLDSILDVAVIKVDAANLPVLELSGADDVEVGQRLLAIGSPLGLDLTVSDGLLSGARLVGSRKLLQISIPVSPGSSGGPVLLETGQVIGMVVSGIRGGGAENLNFALPISYVREILPLVAERVAEPFASVEGARPAIARAGIDRTDLPAIVNDTLSLDYTALDGVEIASEEVKEGQYQQVQFVRYTTSVDVTGAPVLERQFSQTTRVPNPQFRLTIIDYLKLDVRSVIRMDGRKTQTFIQQTPLSTHARNALAELEYSITDTVAVLSTSRSTRHTEWVPRGIIPSHLQGAAIAALPNELPEQVFLWTVSPDTAGTKVVPVRLKFGAATTKRIPIARPGTSCSERNTKQVAIAVVPVTEASGATQTEFFVFAARPHIRFDPFVKCIKAPTLVMEAR
jgi:S1-C subfamily serine protease